MKIRLEDIVADTEVLIRERNDEETIERYEERLESLPPVIVFRRGEKYILADGFHRKAAAERKGRGEIEAEVREGSYEEACEYAIVANINHGKPLTAEEYEKGLRRLKNLHRGWTQEKLARTLNRSQEWVSGVLAAGRVGEVVPGSKLDTRTKAEISRAPKELWRDIVCAAEKEGWTKDETQERVKAIKGEPSRAQEFIQAIRMEVPEAPADKLIPLTKEINKLCKMEDQFCNRLDPSLYDWRSGALATLVLQGLYVLGEKTGKLAEKTKEMIEFLEAGN